MSTALQRRILSIAVGAALTLFAFGCGDGSDSSTQSATTQREPAQPAAKAPPAPPAPAKAPEAPAGSGAAGPADAKAGKADYQIYCASCHGETGAGDGPVSQTLSPKPARHNDGNYMNPLTDDYLFKVIKFGGASVGKSPMMAPWGGAVSDAQIRNIIAYIRSLADPPYRP